MYLLSLLLLLLYKCMHVCLLVTMCACVCSFLLAFVCMCMCVCVCDVLFLLALKVNTLFKHMQRIDMLLCTIKYMYMICIKETCEGMKKKYKLATGRPSFEITEKRNIRGQRAFSY